MFKLLATFWCARLGRACAVLLALVFAPWSAWAQNDWRACADEGRICQINGEALVRFGVDGRYVYRMAQQQIDCDTDTFGDPAPGVRKRCELSYSGRQPAWPTAGRGGWFGQGDRWQVCAGEGQICRLPDTVRVRYGANGRYVERVANGNLACSNDVFGDPAPGVSKQCEYLPGSATAKRPDQSLPTPVLRAGLDWQRCAYEDQDCRFSGSTMVRFGTDGRWLYREVSNGVRCGSQGFGSDPAPGYPKHCDLLILRP